MPDCPIVECGDSAAHHRRDCCPVAEVSLAVPCCSQHIEAAAAPTRLAEKPAAPAIVSVDVPDTGASLVAETPWASKGRPFRALDCLSQSCVLRI
jgi:hypothetical protein